LAAPAALAQDAPAETVTDAPGEDEGTPAWFRLDTDGLATQFWVGATHDLGAFKLASDIYVVGTTAELDLGPSIAIGDALTLIPMAGIVFDFAADKRKPTYLVAPQLFTYLTLGKIYFESWIQSFLASPFADDDPTTADDGNTLYTRNFLLINPVEGFGFGPHMEATWALNDAAGDGLASMILGGAVQVEYGKNNILLLALGYDTKQETGDRIGGRFTFVRVW